MAASIRWCTWSEGGSAVDLAFAPESGFFRFSISRVQGNVLTAGDLGALPGATATDPAAAEPPAGGPDLRFGGRLPQLKEIGDLLVAEALRRTGGNQSRAAALLGVSHQALSKRLRSRRDP